MPSFQTYLKAIKSEVAETDVGTVHKVLEGARGDHGAAPVLIDVREQDEYVQGYIPGARWIPRGFLELRIEDAVPDRDRADRPLLRRRHPLGAGRALAARARLHQRRVAGRRLRRVEAGRLPVRQRRSC